MLEYGGSCFVYHQYGFFCFEALSWQWLTCTQDGVLPMHGNFFGQLLHYVQSHKIAQMQGSALHTVQQLAPYNEAMNYGASNPVHWRCGATGFVQELATSSKSWLDLNLSCALIFHGMGQKTDDVELALSFIQHVPWLGLSMLSTYGFLVPAVFKPRLHVGLWACHGLIGASGLAYFILIPTLNQLSEFYSESLDSELFTS